MTRRSSLGARLRADTGAGGALALAVVMATVVVALAVLSLGSALAVRQRAVAAADAAALAAADVLLGAFPGEPCALAAEVALAHRVELGACTLEGAEAVVTVETAALGIRITESARAGPPR